MPQLDVCVIGEINLDLVLYGLPKELTLDCELLANKMALTLGSSSAIFAHNLSALGTKVGFISKIGSDLLGKIALERLAAADRDTHHDWAHCSAAPAPASLHSHLSRHDV
jgi:sugar/nucleoside kinase (ribokinase family)